MSSPISEAIKQLHSQGINAESWDSGGATTLALWCGSRTVAHCYGATLTAPGHTTTWKRTMTTSAQELLSCQVKALTL